MMNKTLVAVLLIPALAFASQAPNLKPLLVEEVLIASPLREEVKLELGSMSLVEALTPLMLTEDATAFSGWRNSGVAGVQYRWIGSTKNILEWRNKNNKWVRVKYTDGNGRRRTDLLGPKGDFKSPLAKKPIKNVRRG